MDGVEEERRGSQGKRNSNVGGRGEDIHGDGEPLLERLLPHQRRAIASALLFLKAAAISPARATKAQLLRFLLFFILSLSFFSSFFHSLTLLSFFFCSSSLSRAKLGYYRCYYHAFSLLHFRSVSSFHRFFSCFSLFCTLFSLSLSLSFLLFVPLPLFSRESSLCNEQRVLCARARILFGLSVFVGESVGEQRFFS